MKVVINKCFGGFGLSDEAERLYAKKAGFEIFRYTNARDDTGNLEADSYIRVDDNSGSFLTYTFKKDYGEGFNGFPEGDDSGYWYSHDIERDDPLLVQVIEELKEKANGSHASLDIIDIPDGVEWEIDEYDGNESIHELHRSWC